MVLAGHGRLVVVVMMMMLLVMVMDRPVKMTRGHVKGPGAPRRLHALSPGRFSVCGVGLDQGSLLVQGRV